MEINEITGESNGIFLSHFFLFFLLPLRVVIIHQSCAAANRYMPFGCVGLHEEKKKRHGTFEMCFSELVTEVGQPTETGQR